MSRQLVLLWRVPLPHMCHLVSPRLIFVHSHDTILKINGLNFNSRNDTVSAIFGQSCFSRTYGAHWYNLFTKRTILYRHVVQKLCPFPSFSEGEMVQISGGVLLHPIRIKMYLCVAVENLRFGYGAVGACLSVNTVKLRHWNGLTAKKNV